MKTHMETFISNPRRERGVYKDGGVSVELEYCNGDYVVYAIDVFGPQDLTQEHHDLVKKIKQGSIRPTISYEDPQMGPTRQELEKMLTEAQSELSEREREVEGCLARIAQLEKKRKPGFWRCIPLP